MVILRDHSEVHFCDSSQDGMTGDLRITLPGIPAALIASLVEQAQLECGDRLALVGGAVRDAMLHQVHRDPWRELPDLDFLLEGSCAAFVQCLQDRFGCEHVSELQLHQQFGTAELVFDGVQLDVASARTEIYPAPGENPVVQPGSIEQDLARRDFTVNAMALVFQADGSQQLCDPHCGREHLAKRQLAFLHQTSVADDPTRIVRGARYAARLGFDLAPDALLQVQSTLAVWPWLWRFGDPVDAVPPALGTRLRMELELLLEREPWHEALTLLKQWTAMPLLDWGLQQDPRLCRRFVQATRFDLPALAVLVAAASDPVSLASRLQIPKQQQIWIEGLVDLRYWLAHELMQQDWTGWGALEWTQCLEKKRWLPEVVALAVLDNTPFRRPLLRWWGRWRHVTSPVCARELIAQGMCPGPDLGHALRRLREQKLQQMR